MFHTDRIDSLATNLKLHGIKENLTRRIKQAMDDKLGHEDFLNLLLHDEADFRKNNRIQRLLRVASLRQPASIENFDWSHPRGLDKKVIADLATCRFIREGYNVIIMGPTGVGKTHIASALGNTACRNGHSTLSFRMNTLVEQIGMARAKGTYLNLVKRLAGCDLLILDDFGIKPLVPQQFQDLYDILDERSEAGPTVMTSQLPVANWNEVIGDPVTCEAITDRLVSRAIIIQMKGGTYRAKRGHAATTHLTKADPT
jgi:DNA replication protein DnaC